MTELDELCNNYLEYELRAAESLHQALNDHSHEEIEDEFVETTRELIRKFDDPSRKKTVLVSAFRVGEAMGSQSLTKFATDSLEEWRETYGE